jgi:hypothetical protein
MYSNVSSIKSLPKWSEGSVRKMAPLNAVSSVMNGKANIVVWLEMRMASMLAKSTTPWSGTPNSGSESIGTINRNGYHRTEYLL